MEASQSGKSSLRSMLPRQKAAGMVKLDISERAITSDAQAYSETCKQAPVALLRSRTLPFPFMPLPTSDLNSRGVKT